MAIRSLKTCQSAFCRVGWNETKELGRHQVMQALESQERAGILAQCRGKRPCGIPGLNVSKAQHSHS